MSTTNALHAAHECADWHLLSRENPPPATGTYEVKLVRQDRVTDYLGAMSGETLLAYVSKYGTARWLYWRAFPNVLR